MNLAVLHYDYNFYKFDIMNKIVFSRQSCTTDNGFSKFEHIDKFESAKSRNYDRPLKTENRPLKTENRLLKTENRPLKTKNCLLKTAY